MSSKNALFVTHDTHSFIEFARGLTVLGWTLFARGPTGKALRAAGLHVENPGKIVLRNPHGPYINPALTIGFIPVRRIGDTTRFDILCSDLPSRDTVMTTMANGDGATVITQIINASSLLHAAVMGRRLVVATPAIAVEVLERLRIKTAADPRFRQYLGLLTEELISYFTLDMSGVISPMCRTSE
ncbi:hypothetical protein HY478_01865 [Candidatus Uhrbacteria bacterium]|nr:hypothetical protein [Candidatus Uhrbacteria bacterium]